MPYLPPPSIDRQPAGVHCLYMAAITLRQPICQVVALAKELQGSSGKRVLWGTAQLFKHPRYLHGAATSEGAAWLHGGRAAM